MNWTNILERAGWTFLEGFLVAFPSATTLGLDGAAWKSALFAAACAGLSALKTIIVEIIQKRLEELNAKKEAELQLIEEEDGVFEDEAELEPSIPQMFDDEIETENNGEEEDNDASI